MPIEFSTIYFGPFSYDLCEEKENRLRPHVDDSLISAMAPLRRTWSEQNAEVFAHLAQQQSHVGELIQAFNQRPTHHVSAPNELLIRQQRSTFAPSIPTPLPRETRTISREVTVHQRALQEELKTRAGRLEKLRKNRDEQKTNELLSQLENAAKHEDNLMPLMIECVENNLTLGEICNVLRQEWGEYQANSWR